MAETEFTNGAMPPKVAGAIAAVMGEVKKLAKADTNKHGNYDFTSVDDFLEAVRPLCAKNGLIILQDEESFEIITGVNKDNKPISWLKLRYRFTLAHSSGEVWGHRPARSIMVNGAMGAQGFGAAQSYVLKQFERSLFQIATGEKDLEGEAATDIGTGMTVAAERRKDGDLWSGPLGKTALHKAVGEVVKDIEACSDTDELTALLNTDNTQGIFNQCMTDRPGWFYGQKGSDVEGLEARVERRKTELEKETA